jgi:hypothetical protein
MKGSLDPGGMNWVLKNKKDVGLDLMVHTCNPSYSGDRDRMITVQGQPWWYST